MISKKNTPFVIMREILPRKIVHIITVGMFAVFVYFIDDVVPRSVYILISVFMLVGFLGFDFYRKIKPDFNEKVFRNFPKIFKETERNRFLDGLWGPINLFVLVLLFSKMTIISTVFIGAFSDPMAAIIGTRYGRKKNNAGKTSAGMIAYYIFAVVGTVLGKIYVGSTFPYLAIFLLAVVPALLEGHLKHHDNVIAPMTFAVLLEFTVRYIV
jgi:dolichol kinase